MAWFAVHSALMLLLAFVVGLLSGWLIWGLRWVRAQEHVLQRPEVVADPVTGTSPPHPAEELWTASAVPAPAGHVPPPAVIRMAPQPVGPTIESHRAMAAEVIARNGSTTQSQDAAASPVGTLVSAAASAGARGGLGVEVGGDAGPFADPELADRAPTLLPRTGEPQDWPATPPSVADVPEGEGEGDAAEPVSAPEAVGDAPADAPGATLIDDLTEIDGVTPQMAAALASEGLGSFFAVANASEDELRRALRVNRIRSAPGIAFWASRAAELVEQAQAESASEDAVEALDEHPADVPAAAAVPATAPIPLRPRDTPPPIPASATAPVVEPTAPPALPPAAPAAPAETTPRTLDAPAPAPAPTPTPAPAPAPGTRGRRPVPGAAFRTTAHPEGPSWTSVAPSAEEDLEQIHGVDAAIAEALRAAGVTNYTLLAAVRDEELRQILADVQIAEPATLSTWSVQAALLLQGDRDGAATLVGGLMMGRENT